MLVARGLCAAPPGAAVVVRDFSLDLQRGQWIALAGPNGVGKTTLLLTLAGLWPAAGGRLELDGRAFGPQAAGGRSEVAVVLQDPAGQLLQATVADEIAFAARNLGCPEPEVPGRVARWSARLGLESELACDPRTLSAGRQQVVLLAAALASEPRILLLDECGAHLDRSARRVVLEALRREVQSGLSVLGVSQEAEEQSAADRVVSVGGHPGFPETEVHSAGDARARAGKGTKAEADRGKEGWESGSCPVSKRSHIMMEAHIAPWEAVSGPAIRVERPLSLAIGSSGVTAIEGHNGTGKSVLLGAIAGAMAVPQVRIVWSRRPDPPPILAAQHPEHQIFAERVEEEVMFAVRARGGDRKAARASAVFHFEALGLGGDAFLERRTWDLAAGEKRMLQVVAALVAPASLVLLDEPTCGLDLVRRGSLAALVARRAAVGPVVVGGQDEAWHARVGAGRLELGPTLASVDVKTD